MDQSGELIEFVKALKRKKKIKKAATEMLAALKMAETILTRYESLFPEDEQLQQARRVVSCAIHRAD